MKVYLVASEVIAYLKVLQEEGARIMLSFGHCPTGIDKVLPMFRSIALDSGGYQLQTLGRRAPKWINPHQYALWLNHALSKYGDKIDCYFTLDGVRNAQETCQNQRFLEACGLKPVPIWHYGEEIRCLECFCRRYKLIGVGGIGKAYANSTELRKLFTLLGKLYPEVKFHSLGMGLTAVKFARLLKPYSIDCKTWLNPAIYGQRVVTHDGVVKTVDLGEQERERLRRDPARLREALVEAVRAFMALENSTVAKAEGGKDGDRL